MPEAAMLDRDILDEMTELLGAETVANLLQAFAVDLEAALASLRDLLHQESSPARSDSLRRQAHSLKSAAGQMGAVVLGEAAARLEREAEKLGDIAQSGEALTACGTATTQAISAYLRKVQ